MPSYISVKKDSYKGGDLLSVVVPSSEEVSRQSQKTNHKEACYLMPGIILSNCELHCFIWQEKAAESNQRVRSGFHGLKVSILIWKMKKDQERHQSLRMKN
ncbi:hypothetical protein LAZ67_21000142 [Cordylochernes scorpioides]|uniref:Uncharacterized protein n=1 Tax=Cordylochernes scorpioides TaxID=51811 RepID=A0ABY6LL98_9ARAC|nr:hypothetical protein LAZ67_21000142 [Cordylochernes scorpioides]